MMKNYAIALCYTICSVLLSCQSKKADVPAPAYDLKVSEGFKNPLGFYDSLPSFSWKLPLEAKAQSGYSIVVATEPSLLPDKPDLWNTGRVSSDQSTFVDYKGTRLSSRQQVYWQIKYWDEKNVGSDWSETATMEMGLLNNKDWAAKWISLPNQEAIPIRQTKQRSYKVQYLRREFKISGDIEKARLYVSAKGLFDATINGREVAVGALAPGWTPYHKRIETTTFDVTTFVRQGKNAIGLKLAEGWHSGRLLFRGYPEEVPRVIGQLEIHYQNGDTQMIITDQSWQAHSDGPVEYASLYDGESYNANKELGDWAQSGYEAENWAQVEEVPIDDNVRLLPKRHNQVKEKVTLPTRRISTSMDGDPIFDLGQNMAGIPQISIPVKKGQEVKIRFAEMLQQNGDLYTANYRDAISTDYYLPREDGFIEWQPSFTFHGFRYVELSGYDEGHTPEESWVSGVVQHSDFDMVGSFLSSHDKLNRLQSNIEWGLRGNFLDIPTDCPQRNERLGWTGDAQVFIPTSLFIADVHSFWSSWLQSVCEDQRSNGAIPAVVPDVYKKRTSSGWGDVITIAPWEIYLRTGDKKVLADSYQSMKEWLRYYQSKANDHIVDMYTYGDWLQPHSQHPEDERRGETSNKLINTAYYARSLQLTMKTAGVLGLDEEEKMLAEEWNLVRHAFEQYFFDEHGGIKVGKPTQTGYLIALAFDLLAADKKSGAILRLIDEIEKADNHLRTGFLGTPLLAKVLDDIGRPDLMVEILFKETYPSWFYSINQGATTMWERWNSYTHEEGFHPQGMNSFNHYAYGAIGQWMYERIAGIKPLSPGYKEIGIAPLVDVPLTSAEASYNSPYGKVESAWSLENGVFSLKTTIPPNTTARVSIPANVSEPLLVNGEPLSNNMDSVQDWEKDNGTYKLLVNAGIYHFKSTLLQ
ncbi:MAG: family 78 glycoside hydrolase catalytic domain [Bacteroidota bacterium]